MTIKVQFYESKGLWDFSALVDVWEEAVFVQNKNKERLQSLKDRSKLLWQYFNIERDELRRDYMDRYLDTYLATFFLPNVQRNYAVWKLFLTQELAGRYANLKELRILDFGAGPLSATLGFLAALNEINPKVERVFLYAVERSASAIKAGQNFLQKLSIPVILENLTSPEKCSEPCDLVLAANVINEIPEQYRLVTAQKLLNTMAPHALFLMLEPGQDVHARALHMLRNQILDHVERMYVIGPCLHQKICPLTSAERKEWCWFRCIWDVPESLAWWDEIMGLEHEELTFSWVCWSRTRPLEHVHKARVVSDWVPIGAKTDDELKKWRMWAERECITGVLPPENIDPVAGRLRKVLLCSSSGRLESSVFSGSFDANRGDIVLWENLPNRIREHF